MNNLRTRHHTWLISGKCFQVSGQIIPIEKVKDEAFAKKMMGKSNQTYFSADKLWAGTPNEHVYNMLEDAWFRDMLG